MDNQTVTRGKFTALLADDDHEFRQVLAELIVLHGWHVWEATDGEEALHFAEIYKPDVLVLDHRMPRLSGTQVIQRMHDNEVDVPVVFVSAANDIHDIAANVGVRCYLKKPFGIDEILALMRRALSGHCS